MNSKNQIKLMIVILMPVMVFFLYSVPIITWDVVFPFHVMQKCSGWTVFVIDKALI